MAEIDVFCFPYAGGSAMFYKKWPALRSGLALHPVELAGRGSRVGDQHYDTLSEAVDEACNYVELHNRSGVYALFGHSMGGLLAYETACRLAAAGYRQPEHLFLSSTRCPQSFNAREPVAHLSDEAFMAKIMAYGGTPAEVFADEALKAYVLPILRSDFRLLENHKTADYAPLSCPFTVIYSTNDTVLREDVEPWMKKTVQECEFIIYPGNHFYILEHMDEVYGLITGKLGAYLTAKPTVMTWQ
ncbi:thioesterase II family protein [Paenibacillus tarimensis]|uniref:thioesterase II family protein n=1 Tax=Paenibacillus tarimensis TaxID=416012 RepID=UPI001F3013E7|nr:alpha/beta fold hydrolase [Paenibacillus tarimensis]MCF2945805.1 alpha/beta fold hydrolase [Paenibacillus tarimensis]